MAEELPSIEKLPKSAVYLRVLGDSAWTSEAGKATGFLLRVGSSSYLIDFGAPPFARMTPAEMGALSGCLVTHVHDDHRRWFSDFALFNFYERREGRRVRLLSAEEVLEQWAAASRPALEPTLNAARTHLIREPYASFVEEVAIGPRAKFKLERHGEGAGCFRWVVVETATGNIVPPSQAKVVLEDAEARPRMLFYDQKDRVWVEPEAYYSFCDERFYQANQRPVVDADAGLTIRALKAPAWHGPPTIALRLETESERIFYSSDTSYDPELWRRLAETRLAPAWTKEERERQAFLAAPVLEGQPADYLERVWSRERLEAAFAAHREAVVLHDCGREGSVVHTSYSHLRRADFHRLILMHTPDDFVACHPIAAVGKEYVITGNCPYERVGAQLWPLVADVYQRTRDGQMMVGFKSERGTFVLEQDARGDLKLVEQTAAAPEMPLALYADIDGRYFPYPTAQGECYRQRPAGQVELVHYAAGGSAGKLAGDRRPRLIAAALKARRRKGRRSGTRSLTPSG